MAQFAAATSERERARAGSLSVAGSKSGLRAGFKARARRKVVRMRLVISAHGRDLRAAFSQPYRPCVPIAARNQSRARIRGALSAEM